MRQISINLATTSRPIAMALFLFHLLVLNSTVKAQEAQALPVVNTQEVKSVTVKQAQIRADVDRAQNDLSLLIDEFDRNGMGDAPDVKVFEGVRDSIAKLSDEQIAHVLETLDRARNATNSDDAKSDLSTAYASQQNIADQLQKILIELQQQADLLNVSAQFEALAKRQNENFKATKRLTALARGETLRAAQEDELSIRQIEQDSIGQEATARLQRLEELVKSADPVTASQLRLAMESVPPAKLQETLQSASATLRQSQLYLGTAAELEAYHLLREFARLTKPPNEPAEAVKNAITQLTSMIDSDPSSIQSLASHPDREKGDVQLALSDQQNDKRDDAMDIGKDVQKLAPEAAQTMSQATDAMKQAVSKTNALTFAAAANDEKQALDQLIKARDELTAAHKKMQQKQQKPMEPREPKDQHIGDVAAGTNANTNGSRFAHLPPRDRAAIQQSETEKLPAQYSTQIQQYLMNLAQDSSSDQSSSGADR